MTIDLSRYIVNPGPRVPVGGLDAAVTTDSAIEYTAVADPRRCAVADGLKG